MMKKPLSPLQFRVLSLLLIFAGLLLVVYWVAGKRGLFRFFYNLHWGPPEQHIVLAAGLCFICTMVPVLGLVFGLRVMTDMPSLKEEWKEASLRDIIDGKQGDPVQRAKARRFGLGFGIAGGGAVIGAMVRAGFFEAWFGDPGPWWVAISWAAVFAFGAGFVYAPKGKKLGLGMLYSLAFTLFGIGGLWAVYGYLQMRPEPLTLELMIPLFIGGLPGGALVGAISLLEKPGAAK